MPLDTSTTYPLTRLRLDGRRWNELRFLQAQISTSPASSGSSYLSMGNTAVICTVHGPAEGRRGDASTGGGSAGAIIEVDVNIAGFSGIDRKKRPAGGAGDKQTAEICSALRSSLQSHLHTHLYPHSTITLHVSVLASDGSLLAAALNACTLALVDAGVPMPGLLCGCTAGMSGNATGPKDANDKDSLDPLLDLSSPEELELPYVTVGTTTPIPDYEDADGDDVDDMKVAMIQTDSRLHTTYYETVLAVGMDGCKQVREILEEVIRTAGKKVLEGEGAHRANDI